MKLSDELITRLIWLVKTLWRFGIRDWFLRENLKLLFSSWKHSSSFFFGKNYNPDFLKKSNFVLLAFETCQGAIWSSHSVIRVLINLHHHYHPTLFEAFHSASFCEISVRFVIIKTGHNFQKLSLCISFFLSLCPTTIPMTIFPFFSHMNFFINIELWHFYVIFVTLIWCCVCKINYYF